MAEAPTADIPEIVEIAEIIPAIAAVPAITPDIPEQEEAPAKKRGRPPGARNKPRIIVESLPAPEPAAPEPVAEAQTPDPKKRQRKAVVPVLPEVARLTPAESFRAAMTAWSEMQAQDLSKKGDDYHKLVSAMFK